MAQPFTFVFKLTTLFDYDPLADGNLILEIRNVGPVHDRTINTFVDGVCIRNEETSAVGDVAAEGNVAVGIILSFALVTQFTTISSTSPPSSAPTSSPTSSPTAGPTSTPSSAPTSPPTGGPSSNPSSAPSSTPPSAPTSPPTAGPTSTPTSPPQRCRRRLVVRLLTPPPYLWD
jgi:hypothetical protein